MQPRTVATNLDSLQQSLEELIEKIQKQLIVKETAESQVYVRNL